MQTTKYQTIPFIKLTERSWPDNSHTTSPQWCSLDLYLGSQSLLVPMDINRKLKLFLSLIKMGFKQIAISNPAINADSQAFLQRLLEENLIADDVYLQINVGNDPAIIEKSIPLLKHIPNIIIQLEIPVSETFSDIILEKRNSELLAYAEQAANQIKDLISKHLNQNQVILSLALEDFVAADPQLTLDIAHGVYDIWQPLQEQFNENIIIHLPATVDYDAASKFADQIEWFKKNFNYSNSTRLSVFAKNNRGNANALIELALLAGAERVEGTLLGFGERAGNNDIITTALNLQGLNIEPTLNIKDINTLADTIKECTRCKIPVRHPYIGDLSFTAVSPMQQNIITQGLKRFNDSDKSIWNVPYFNINPTDIGRSYEAMQYQVLGESQDMLVQTLVSHYGFELPELLAVEYSAQVQKLHAHYAKELSATQLREIFINEYCRNKKPIELISINFEKATLDDDDDQLYCRAVCKSHGEEIEMRGTGFGVIDTLVSAIKKGLQLDIDVAHFNSHALTRGSGAQAATYIKLLNKDNHGFWGVGIDSDTSLSSIKAFFNALNRMQLKTIESGKTV